MSDLICIRNAHTERHKNDLLRPLSERGKAQAAERRTKLNDPTFDLILISPAGRTRETDWIVNGGAETKTIEIPELLPPPDPAIDEIVGRIGYTPLDTYLDIGHIGVQKLMDYAHL